MAESILNNRSCSDSIVFLSASELSALSTDARTALYQGGARQLVVENDDTITTHVLKEDGSTVWMGSNKPVVNLLDNSDFTRPVNQRGSRSYSGSGYTIDRWFAIVDNNSTTKNDGNIAIDGFLRQKIVIPDGTYTTACMTSDGTIRARTLNVSGSSVANGDQDGALMYAVYDGGYVNVGIDAGTYFWAALYEGSYTADTLPPYTPKGYAAELEECRRYYRQNEFLNCTKTSGNYFSVSSSVEMRAVPTVSFLSFAPYGKANVTDFTGCSISIAQTTKGVQRITFANLPTCSAHSAGGLAVNLNADL